MYFEIKVREQVTTLYVPDVSAVWGEYVQGFGPVATIHSALLPDRREAFHLALEDFHWPYASQMGLAIPHCALVVRVVRN